MNSYDLVNVKTGEVRENLTSREIAGILDTYTHYIPNLANNETIYRDTYRVIFNHKLERTSEDRFPQALLDDWDKTTSKFRRYINENN